MADFCHVQSRYKNRKGECILETIFDKIITKKIPTELLYEDDHVVAFNDINPQAPTHVLVIPKKKCERFSHLFLASQNEISGFIMGVAQVAKALGLEDNGYRVVINNGRDGQQTVEYLHAHILGGRQLSWPPG
jgi:histidine triad (HIT) family protein